MKDSESEARNSPTSRQPLLIKADEMAHLIGISTRTLWRLVSTNKLPPPIRIGGNVRWRKADIENWISQGCPEVKQHDDKLPPQQQ